MLRGDCSIRVGGLGFTAEEIEACAQRTGLLSIELELPGGAQCTSTCCATASAVARPALSLDEIRGLISQAVALGCRRVILVDAESGPCPFVAEIIADVRGRAMQVERFVHHTALSREQAAFHLEQRVAVSVELSSLENGSGKSHHVRESIDAIDRLCEAGYGRAGAPTLSIRISAGDDNLAEIPAIWRWARTRGIEPQVQIITPRGPTDPSVRLIDPLRARALFEDLARIDSQEFKRAWELPPSLTGRSCKRHLFACHVTACGTIFACVGVTVPLGHIRNETLAEILRDSEVLENIRAYRSKLKEPCGSCCQKTDCYGCRGAAYQLTGDYLAGDAMCWKTNPADIVKLPVDVGDLIPHGPSMRMVDQLVSVGERQSTTEFTVPMNSRWLDAEGKFEEAGYIEMIAQSFAASHGFHMSHEERPMHRGLLLGVKGMIVSGEARAGDRLRIRINKTARFGDFGIVDGEITHTDGRLIAVGQIKVWRPNAELLSEVNNAIKGGVS